MNMAQLGQAPECELFTSSFCPKRPLKSAGLCLLAVRESRLRSKGD